MQQPESGEGTGCTDTWSELSQAEGTISTKALSRANQVCQGPPRRSEPGSGRGSLRHRGLVRAIPIGPCGFLLRMVQGAMEVFGAKKCPKWTCVF